MAMSEDAAKWLEEPDTPNLPKELSENFFNYDEGAVDAINILDMDKMEGVVEQWKIEAHKKIKKKKNPSREVQEIKPEDMVETIGGTVMTERRHAFSHKLPDQKSSPVQPKGTTTDPLPTASLPTHGASNINKQQYGRDRFITSPPDFPTLESTQRDITVPSAWSIPSIRDTINRILIGERYVLEWYKSLDEKKSLLKEAISTHDGNTIITIILFLRSSLNKSLFEVLLLNHQEAAQHYCSFLRQNGSWEQLKAVYYVQGVQRYGMLQYQLALSQETINGRIKALDSVKGFFKDKPSLAKEGHFVEEYYNLLKRQQKMEEIRAKLPPAVINRFQSVPLIDSTLITSLMYCSRFHLNDENPVVNPESFKKDFNIGEKQYFIVLLGSLCAKRDWDYIDRLLTPKGWQSKLGIGSKIKAPISLERLIRIIGKPSYMATEEFLTKYIKQVDDLESRLELATTYHCYGLGIEVIKQLKDNERLKKYFNELPVEKQRKYRPAILKLFS